MEFAGDRMTPLLWNPQQLPGASLVAIMQSLSGMTMSERMRELMRLRSDKMIPTGVSSSMIRDMRDSFAATAGAGLEWD